MSEYVIVTDSTADLPMSLVKKYDLRIVPMMFSVDGVGYPGYVEGEELDYPSFYAKMRGGADVSTSLIDFKICTNVFEDILKTGKDVLYIGFSSGLSGSYNLAKMISEQLEEKYHACIFPLRGPLMPVSSSEIRRKIRVGESVKPYLPEAVWRYIREKNLYGGGVS